MKSEHFVLQAMNAVQALERGHSIANSSAIQGQMGACFLLCGVTVCVLCVQSKWCFGQSEVDLLFHTTSWICI